MPERTMADLLAEYEAARHAYEARPTAATEDAALDAELDVAAAMQSAGIQSVRTEFAMYVLDTIGEIRRWVIEGVPIASTIPVPLKVNADG